jgi:hypothetical protein
MFHCTPTLILQELSEIPPNDTAPAPTQPLSESAATPVEEETHLAEVNKNPPIRQRDEDQQQPV